MKEYSGRCPISNHNIYTIPLPISVRRKEEHFDYGYECA